MFLKEKERVVVNDGKVVMVALTMVDTNTGEVLVGVGRTTCDLTCDEFDLQTGIKIAVSRARQKIAKRLCKMYKAILKDTTKLFNEYYEFLLQVQEIANN